MAKMIKITLTKSTIGASPKQKKVVEALGLRKMHHSVELADKMCIRDSTDPSQVGGGIVFAPKPRDYRYTLPKKLRRLAMKSALSSKVAENEIIVLDELKFEAPKTKEMIKCLENIKAGKKALIVMAEKDENVVRSAANIPGVRTALVGTMNVYEIINHDSFIVTQEAVRKIEEVYL